MRLGVTLFATDRTMPPHELARAVEDRGFASLYLPEHTHIPASRRTPAPATPEASGADTGMLRGSNGDTTLPEAYARTLDPLVSLAAAAAVTTTLRLGTGVMLPAQREPIVTAKAIATLQHLAQGRFVCGIGYGWNVEEAADHGVEWPARRDLVREKMLAMRALWTRELASFAGKDVAFEPSWAWPKADVPVLLGGAAGPKLFAAIAEFGTGWMPIGGAGVRDALPRLQAAFEDAGRDPSEAVVIPFGTLPSQEKLDYYAGLGVEEVVLRLPGTTREYVMPVLDGYASYL